VFRVSLGNVDEAGLAELAARLRLMAKDVAA